ncbi:MAG: hypothetical protein KA715_07855 [Xanthomonadaceae bacterium]|nr:hypothetical protein [Xanthomonadaceae bacterium]
MAILSVLGGAFMTPKTQWYRSMVSRIPIPDRYAFPFSHPYGAATKIRVWVHGASAGEWETLIPIVERMSDGSIEWIMTTFSRSGLSSVQKFSNELAGKNESVIYAGLSPREGDWLKALTLMKPKFCMTAKYEAWPEWWMSLNELSIPLVIIQTQWRSSLATAKGVLTTFLCPLPKLYLNTPMGKDTEIRKHFPDADVFPTFDPRKDRIRDRMIEREAQTVEKLKPAINLPKPWGVLGSVWPSDLPILMNVLKKTKDTIWVVPHDLSTKNLDKIMSYLPSDLTVIWSKWSDRKIEAPQFIIVDQFGWLAELYSLASWAYVGGGFGQGIHSTLEPGVLGVPVSSGPKRVAEFSETEWLSAQNILTIVKKPKDFELWRESLTISDAKRSFTEIEGGTQKVVDWIKEKLWK